MVLLHLLHQLAGRNRWKLTVAHFNHQLRGRSSDADERLVRRTAEHLGLPFLSERADVRKLARSEKLSIEMAARRLRHDFLARAGLAQGIETIALAHHADDQLELFFLRLLRGSGGEGLAGMKWKSPSPTTSRIELVRPLLGRTKAELAAFAKRNSIKFREDATNAQIDFQRNRIRHELLPLLRKHYQPALDQTVLRAIEVIRAEVELTAQLARQWLRARASNRGFPTLSFKAHVRFEELPIAVQRKCVQLQLLQQGVVPDFDLVEKLRNDTNARICVSGTDGRSVITSATPKSGFRRVAMRDESGIVRLKDLKKPEFNLSSTELRIERTGKVRFGKLSITWRRIPGSRTVDTRGIKQKRELFDAEKLGKTVLLRHWLPGDRIRPIGMSHEVKLQDFFTNQKVPKERRRELVVATTAGGEIFWIEGQRISERFKLSARSKRWLEWRWREDVE